MTNAENIGAPAARAVQKKASGSSFYMAMRLMPAEERDAMFAIYAFCRKVDDIADDGVGTRSQRHERLDGWRRDLRALYEGTVAREVRFLAPAIKHYGLRLEDFLTVLDGMDMDVAEDIVAPDLATLDLYCDRVASAVGRLSVRIFDVPQAQARPLADHLGRALQLTNILRDLDEDAAIGRLYLPREALDAAGISESEPHAVVMHPQLAQACAPLLARAREHFAQAARIMDACRRTVVRSPRLMAAVYSDLLDRIEQRGFAPPRSRARVGKSRLLLAVLRHGVV
jgi:phytoene synthase